MMISSDITHARKIQLLHRVAASPRSQNTMTSPQRGFSYLGQGIEIVEVELDRDFLTLALQIT